MKILIIDDNEINLKILQMILSIENDDIKTINSCEELDFNKVNDIDLVLVSNKFIDNLKNMKGVNIVMFSMTPSIDEVVKAYAEGINDYIILPSTSTLIRKSIKNAIGERKSLDEILLSIRPVQSKDNGSYKHLERIKEYAKTLATELKETSSKFEIDEAFIKDLELASTLHDIGKSQVCDKILKKADKLTEEEFEDIKTHTTLGYNILNKINNTSFIEMAKEIVLSHHERQDGTGYPDNKAGDEIPLSAKIIAVCDVYDALRETRTYKETFSHERSVEIIKGNSKSQFDPLVIEAFEKVHNKFEEIFSNINLKY